MKVVSIAEMREIDERAQSQYGISAFALMRAAGIAVADEILESYNPGRVTVVCGKGNNAGDGFVIARRLHEAGLDVQVCCLEQPDVYKGAAREAWDQLSSGIQRGAVVDLKSALESTDLVVDALLGTGISGTPRGPYLKSIEQINQCGKAVVSVDVPSGLREFTAGEKPDGVVRATATVTIGLPKTILLTHPGAGFAGRVTTHGINFPRDLLESDEWKLNWARPDQLREWLPPRTAVSNKGTWGHVGIIGSCLEYAGATVMTARSALRAGCGLATIYTLPTANVIYKMALPEATSVIIGSAEQTHFSAHSAQHFIDRCRSHNILVAGPGMGQSPGAAAFLQMVLNTWKKPLLLDADALNLLADGRLDMLRDCTDCLITPHPGEIARLTGLSVDQVQANRERVARDFAQTYGVCVLLKGADTLVAHPDGQTWIVPGADAALAKGGSGDVLAGVIAALFGQGMPLWQAAVLGATVHLQAGKNCAKKSGTRGVLATEIADEVPRVLDVLEFEQPQFYPSTRP